MIVCIITIFLYVVFSLKLMSLFFDLIGEKIHSSMDEIIRIVYAVHPVCNIVDIYSMAVNNTADSTEQVINRFEWNPPLYFLIVMNGITINTPLTGIPIIVAMITDINNGDISNTKLFNAY